MSDLYAERDIIKQEEFYTRHVSAMTKEGLDRKSDIAAELAHRDITVSNQQKHIEALQARVAELYDLIKYAQVDSGVCMCGDDIKDHNQSSGHMPLDIWDHAVEQINKEGSSEAFILRKQAEALCACAEELKMSNRYEDPIFIRGMATAHGFITGTSQTLIDEAAKAEGADNAG